MSRNYYFKDRTGAQNGPVSFDELVSLARSGRLAPDCLVWPEGGEPVAARRDPALSQIFGAMPGAGGAAGGGPLVADFPGWGLFWRGLVVSLGVALVVTAPWAGLWFYRWFASRVSLPGGQRLRLESEIGACWPLFAGMGLAEILPIFVRSGVAHGIVQVICALASYALGWMLVGWFARSLRCEDGSLKLDFTGGLLAYVGWTLLIFFGIFTIIGWAWAFKFQMRWMCRNVVGTHAFEFVAGGWDILWRSFAAALGCLLILPIPWILAWYANWLASQIVVTPGAAAPALQQAA